VKPGAMSRTHGRPRVEAGADLLVQTGGLVKVGAALERACVRLREGRTGFRLMFVSGADGVLGGSEGSRGAAPAARRLLTALIETAIESRCL